MVQDIAIMWCAHHTPKTSYSTSSKDAFVVFLVQPFGFVGVEIVGLVFLQHCPSPTVMYICYLYFQKVVLQTLADTQCVCNMLARATASQHDAG